MEPSFELKERDGCICGLTPELSGAGGVRLERIVRPHRALDNALKTALGFLERHATSADLTSGLPPPSEP
jgi:hypothetical protein